MWYNSRFYQYTIGIILVLTTILLFYYSLPVFVPILWFIGAIFLPILFATLLYYILRPLLLILEKWLPKGIAIFIIYILVLLIVISVFLALGPELIILLGSISTENIGKLSDKIIETFNVIRGYLPLSTFQLMEETLKNNIPRINEFLYKAGVHFFSTAASITISIALTPFVLYYFLKDDVLFSKFILRYVPSAFNNETQKILVDIDNTLSEFIQAQMTLAVMVGTFLLIGYLIIGLPHPIALAVFATVFYVIPFLGTFIAVIPAIFVALTIDFMMVLKVIGVMFAAHLIEANFLTPRLMSTRLNIHPLTIILLLLAAGSLFGILGLLLATPTYAILKVIIWNIYKIARLHYTEYKQKSNALQKHTGLSEDPPHGLL